MILIVPHNKTKEEATAIVAAADDLFSEAAGGAVAMPAPRAVLEGVNGARIMSAMVVA